MADSATSAPAPAATPKKAKSAASKKPRTKPSHPPTSDMVNAAIKNLKERGGSSLQAIKKYISANYKVDAEKLAPFIRKYLKAAVASGTLTQPKGKGASGSFKLSVKGESGKAPAKKTAKKAVKPKGEKKPKAAGAPKKAKKPAAAKKPKSPSKAKKVSKPPTKKPKSPKPKKAAVKKPKTPKKAAAKKK